MVLIGVNIMWFTFGVVSIVFSILGVVSEPNNAITKLFRFTGISATGITVWCFYADAARAAVNEDASYLFDVLPTVSNYLWMCILVSIMINGISLYREIRSKNII